MIAQVALSVVLLCAAGLFIHHLSDLRNLNLGFQREHLLLATLNPARSGYTGERLSAAYRELLDRLAAIPGVIDIQPVGLYSVPTNVNGVPLIGAPAALLHLAPAALKGPGGPARAGSVIGRIAKV